MRSEGSSGHMGRSGPLAERILGRGFLIFFLIFFNVLFIFETGRDRARTGEGQREGDTESEAGSRLRAVSTEPDAGLGLTDREIMT